MKPTHIISLIILVTLIFVAVNYDNIFNIELPISNETISKLQSNSINTNNINSLTNFDFDKDFINNKSGIEFMEFSDFECPFCKQSSPHVKQILYTYNGKLNYKYIHLGGHKNTINAALAVECAREQNKFWAYHYLLFEDQNSFSDKKFKQFAQKLNLNTIQFNECYESQKYVDLIKEHFNLANKLKVTGTPTYFLNGEQVFLDEVNERIN